MGGALVSNKSNGSLKTPPDGAMGKDPGKCNCSPAVKPAAPAREGSVEGHWGLERERSTEKGALVALVTALIDSISSGHPEL